MYVCNRWYNVMNDKLDTAYIYCSCVGMVVSISSIATVLAQAFHAMLLLQAFWQNAQNGKATLKQTEKAAAANV